MLKQKCHLWQHRIKNWLLDCRHYLRDFQSILDYMQFSFIVTLGLTRGYLPTLLERGIWLLKYGNSERMMQSTPCTKSSLGHVCTERGRSEPKAEHTLQGLNAPRTWCHFTRSARLWLLPKLKIRYPLNRKFESLKIQSWKGSTHCRKDPTQKAVRKAFHKHWESSTIALD